MVGMKRFLVGLVFLFPTLVLANQGFGFLDQNLWVSPAKFFSGDEVRIYAVVFNGSDEDIFGAVGFFDNGEAVDEVEFSLAGGGRLRDVWADWKAVDGEHRLSAKIIWATMNTNDGEAVELSLANQESGEILYEVDFDTDKDGIGDLIDEDDDDDGLSDVEEIGLGLDPKLADSDEDGLLDGKDGAPLTFNLNKNNDFGSEVALAQVNNGGILNVFENFRVAQVVGLADKKEKIKAELAQREAEVVEQKSAATLARNVRVDPTNEALGQEFLRSADEKADLPDLAPSRILKVIYLGVVYLGLFIFENKLVFYGLLALIVIKFLWIIFRRIFRRS